MFISRTIAALLLASALFACGGGNSTSPTDTPIPENPGIETSDLYISLTDAEGDFLSYLVEVTKINLIRANGTVIETLPQTTSVDFAQYVELSELLTRLSLPAGRYDSASLTLDFSNAQIIVQGDNGEAIPAVAVDEMKAPLGQVDVDIQFGDREGFVLLPRRSAQLTLDFDLDASNVITVDGAAATVEVNPVLIADTILEDIKPFRIRGTLKSVALDKNTFEMDLRPFRVRNREYGNITVHVDGDTLYEINGETIASENGLMTLADLGLATPVITFGSWNRNDHSFTASEVRAGSSVPWGEADILRGTVVSRDGDVVVVRGATVEFSEGLYTFNDEVSVQLGAGTRVVKAREIDANVDSISVGSAVYVSGELIDDATLDASSGLVRIVQGILSGTVVSASPLAVNLSMINGRRAPVYDFSGTGISEDNDADPAYYEIALGSLIPENLSSGDPVRAAGWVVDFGAAPEDFEASSLRNAANVLGHMHIVYSDQGASTAVASLSAEGILLDTTEAGTRHHMVFAGIPVDLNSLQAGVPLVVPGSERGVFALSIGRRIVVASSYSRFIELLTDELESGRKVVRFDAQGFYDSVENQFTSKRLRLRLSE